MKKKILRMATGSLLVLLVMAMPASGFAEEYTLDDLYRIALTRSEILKVAEENLVISEVGTDRAFSFLIPRLTATGGASHHFCRGIRP
jgi:outer membrane protein TolC